VYQLDAEREAGLLDVADRLLLIPDLIGYLLTGQAVTERTNASTTGLIDIDSGEWNRALLCELSIPDHLFTPLVEPGTRLGPLRESLGLDGACELVTVGSHDTASAVVAVPAEHDAFAYVSSGTWSLVGLELPGPVVSEAARDANFTNEAGVDGRVRFLQNVSGLWLLDETVRGWRSAGHESDLTTLLEQAAAVDSAGVVRFDAADPRFLAPGDIPGRIADWCAEHDVPAPRGRAELVRGILESLAEAYARSIRRAVELSGQSVTTVHIVGGGSRNRLLCQLTADRTGLPVLAGPAEATAVGNVVVQARALGVISGSLEALRAIVAASFPPRRYLPASGSS
ncbi:MAG: rhamnulokinase, partial [Stackebrandtia sp.]